jgi:hypothetical protein
MSQEARGLDAGQRLVARLMGLGDRRTAGIVAQIALEEKAHVAIGEWEFRGRRRLSCATCCLWRDGRVRLRVRTHVHVHVLFFVCGCVCGAASPRRQRRRGDWGQSSLRLLPLLTASHEP